MSEKKIKSVGNRIDLSQFAISETGEFTCYGNIYNYLDHAGDVTLPGAFDASIEYHKEMGTMPRFLFNHSDNAVVGKWLSMEADDTGLLLKGKINLETDLGKQIYQNLKAGDLDSFSIQYETLEEEERDGINYLIAVHVVEVSVVTFPCNEASLLIDIKSRYKKSKEEDVIETVKEDEVEESIFSKSDIAAFSKRLKQIVNR
ncbi:HK97 family phage prohead protease [Aeromonas hydrophila]|uniref:HK97 family phage prohead protease n=1 Tax=Aeromonas hydrophila TaxID=644 RepID=UPI00107EA71B|nr:HK97 family phage prohead protease [Aeromonas hydrophila]QBX71551.1 HK97 family phage prohead protease [Aeromonas hydrophila]QBX76251.1 HK97 family phage prohead protease [Aeromonas hydrophila]